MRRYADLPDEPGGVDLDALDERRIDALVLERAGELAAQALGNPAIAAKIVRSGNEENPEALCAFAREVLAIVASNREPVSMLTDAERMQRLVASVVKALLPMAEIVAEESRDRIQERYIQSELRREAA